MDDLEQQLREFKPLDPPAALRARVLKTAVGRRRPGWLAWVPTVAAAALIALFYTQGAAARAAVTTATGAGARAREQIIEALSLQLGGDPFARVMAETFARADEENTHE